jgi:soluble lytic murein transglycosylase-like protein
MTTDEIKYLIIEAAKRNGASPLQALAQAKQESGFSQSAISPAGAIGVFQLMPGTAADLGVNPYDLNENIDGGTRYIRQCNNWFPGRLDLALSAYNWGVGNTYKMIWGSTLKPPQSSWPSPEAVLQRVPNETRDYIQRVTGYMTELVNDPVYIASEGGSVPPDGTVDISNSDIQLIAGVVIFGMLAWVLLRR